MAAVVLVIGLMACLIEVSIVKQIEQKFIADYIIAEGGFLPNSFMDTEFMDRLETKGYILPEEPTYNRYVSGIRKRFPHLCITPFARSKVDDDVACFTSNDGKFTGTVVIMHDFTEKGWEFPRFFSTLSEWLQSSDGV